MPWGQEKDGRFYFVGNLAQWVQDYQTWYSQDLPNTQPEMFRWYLFHLTLAYGMQIYNKWTSEGKDTTELRKMLIQDPQTAHFKNDVFTIMDFFAEHANGLRAPLSTAARQEALGTLKEMGLIK